MNRTKVLICITKSDWGGAQKYVADIARYVAAQPHFDVAVVVGRHERGGEDVFRACLKNAGIRTINLPDSGRDISLVRDIRTLRALVRIFTQEQPDVVHLNSTKMGGLGAVAARIACLPGIRRMQARVPTYIYTIHGLPFLEDRSGWARMLIRVATYITALLVTRVITISHAEAAHISSWPGVGEKVVTIYNGIDASLLLSRDEARAALARKCDIDCTGKVVIGSIAELTHNKGHSYLLEALARLHRAGAEFVFINFGGGELARALDARTRELMLHERVHWFGFVPDAYYYLRALDMFVLPSVKEGMPFTLLEAGLAGLPVVATDVGGVSEIITDDTGILVPPRDPVALAHALTTLIESQSIRTELGTALQHRVSTTFTQEEMLEKTITLYTHVRTH